MFRARGIAANLAFWVLFATARANDASVQDADFWNTMARERLTAAVNRQENRGVAKNVLFFVGDGFDITTMTAARIYKGQLKGLSGEEEELSVERFPHVALTKTYNTDRQIPDSAGTATSLFCGVKTKFGVTGLDDRVNRGDCSSAEGAAQLDSLLRRASRKGKATGFVTTTRVTHATPAALYARTVDRNWEDDADIPADQAGLGCTDIASQLVDNSSFINVILGGGRRAFLPNTMADVEYGSMGSRTDGRDLVTAWLGGKANAQYVWNQTAFGAVDAQATDYLLGLFEPSNMNYDGRRDRDLAGEPSIAEMTRKAIEILQKNDEGYFLMVEGGRIDHAHHEGLALDALKDGVAFDEAIATALNMTNSEDTLIIVSADHAHVFTIGGYPTRGSDIMGLNDYENGTDGLPLLILTYANGPGGISVVDSYEANGTRPNHLNSDTASEGFLQDAPYPLIEETHGGQDVSVHALGPWSHLFTGVQEQNYVAHAVRFAACYGDDDVNACTMMMNDQGGGEPQPCAAAPLLSVAPVAARLLQLLAVYIVTIVV